MKSGYENIDPAKSVTPMLHPIKGATLILSTEAISETPDLVKEAAIKSHNIRFVWSISYSVLVLLILVQLLSIVKSLKSKRIYLSGNLRSVKIIAWLFLFWVVFYFVLYQIATQIIPLEVVRENINLIPLNINIWSSITESLDMSSLFVFFLLYIISIAIREGIKLQEQADLTI